MSQPFPHRPLTYEPNRRPWPTDSEMAIVEGRVGQEVAAMTYADDDRDVPPQEVHGNLVCRYVTTLDYRQCWVGRVQVNPGTIRELQEYENER